MENYFEVDNHDHNYDTFKLMETFEDTQYNPNLCESRATGNSVKTENVTRMLKFLVD